MSRRRIGQEKFGFAVDRGQHSSLDELAKLIDWVPIDQALCGRYQLNTRSGICGIDRWHEHRDRQLQAPPFPAADHRPCGLALRQVPLEPASGRGNAAGARDRDFV